MPRFILPLLLALIGFILFGQGAYIHAKAPLAQVLLERAFNTSIATGAA
jgi:sortase A